MTGRRLLLGGLAAGLLARPAIAAPALFLPLPGFWRVVFLLVLFFVGSVTATRADGSSKTFTARVLLLTPKEVEYFRNGGLLQYVLRQLASQKAG